MLSLKIPNLTCLFRKWLNLEFCNKIQKQATSWCNVDIYEYNNIVLGPEIISWMGLELFSTLTIHFFTSFVNLSKDYKMYFIPQQNVLVATSVISLFAVSANSLNMDKSQIPNI